MRVVWVAGRDSGLAQSLDQILNAQEKQYLFRAWDRWEDVPPSHFASDAVVFVVDAFCPWMAGFSILEKLQAQQTVGAKIFLGTPSPKDQAVAFQKYGVNVIVPDTVKSPAVWMAGFIKAQFAYSGKTPVGDWLLPGGHHTEEKIKSLADFDGFTKRLMTFGAKFGVESGLMENTLKAMGRSHIEDKKGVPHLDQEFSVYFGVDREKILVGVQVLSKGAEWSVFQSEMAAMLSGGENKAPSLMFPEYAPVFRNNGSFILIGGSAVLEKPTLDPLTLLAHFPLKGQAVQPILGLQRVHKYRPLNAAMAEQVPVIDLKTTAAKKPVPAKTEVASLSAEQAKDLIDSAAQTGTLSEGAMGAQDRKELEELRSLNEILSRDVQRLMKMRKIPSSDAELKDRVKFLEQQNRELKAQLQGDTKKSA